MQRQPVQRLNETTLPRQGWAFVVNSEGAALVIKSFVFCDKQQPQKTFTQFHLNVNRKPLTRLTASPYPLFYSCKHVLGKHYPS